MIKKTLTALLLLAVAAISLSACDYLPAFGQKTYDEKLASLYKNSVPLIHPRQLLDWEKSDKPLVILDTRSQEEFAVSHLSGAEFIDYDNFELSDVSQVDKESTIVVYCSVGYRSERIGEELERAGYQHVYNLYGGIFQWKNEDNQVVNNLGQPTDSVHTYNARWSRWLDKGIKVY